MKQYCFDKGLSTPGLEFRFQETVVPNVAKPVSSRMENGTSSTHYGVAISASVEGETPTTGVCRVPDLASEVKAFIGEQGLEDFVGQVGEAASEAFGYPVRLDPYIFEDPETGIPTLSIRILVRNLRESRAPFSRLCHSWWYDRVAEYGGRVSLKVAQDSGL